MHDIYMELEELCETVSNEIQKANEKVRSANGALSAGDVEYLDKLTHMLKSIKTAMAMMDPESYSGSYNDGIRPYGYMRGGSYARGRKRDSMGRYSGRGYSRDGGEMTERLRELMEESPDDRIRQEMQKLISKIESM